jgi:hypothetical protein
MRKDYNWEGHPTSQPTGTLKGYDYYQAWLYKIGLSIQNDCETYAFVIQMCSSIEVTVYNTMIAQNNTIAAFKDRLDIVSPDPHNLSQHLTSSTSYNNVYSTG